MKNVIRMGAALAAVLLFAGCVTEKLPSEDLEVLTVCRKEIAVLKSPEYPPNSKIKYDAARSLLSKVDFSYTRRVETLDAIFSAVDAKVDKPRSARQTLSFYYQYDNHSIRFLFMRYQNFVVRFRLYIDGTEVDSKGDRVSSPVPQRQNNEIR